MLQPLTRSRAAFGEARAILCGESAGELIVHVPPEFDVKALRRKLGMSRSQFAESFGFGLATVQTLGAGPRPRGPSTRLKVIEHDPDAVRGAWQLVADTLRFKRNT